jgi:hypothetical protein
MILLATSTDVEHVFSCGHILLSHICNLLSTSSTCAIMCLGYWSLMGLIKDNNILEVTKLPDKPLGDEDGDGYKDEDDWDGLLNSE